MLGLSLPALSRPLLAAAEEVVGLQAHAVVKGIAFKGCNYESNRCESMSCQRLCVGDDEGDVEGRMIDAFRKAMWW